MADHVPTQEPYGTNASNDPNAGTFTIGILSSDGFEDSPPENYTIFFSQSSGITETNSFCVTTSFGHQTNTWQYYTFSLDDLKYYFNDPAGTNIYYRVRANNETDNSVSELTNESTWNLYAGQPFEFNQTDWSAPTGTDACNPYVVTTTTTTTTTTTIPPAVPDDATNVSVNYQGKDVYFAWEYTDGNTLVNEFHINYSYDNATWDRVVITDTSARTYTLDYTNIQTGTFYWTFSVCGDIQNGESCTDSDSNNFETTEYVPPTTTTLPPPPPPPPPPPTTTTTLYVVVNEDGSTSEYNQTEVEDGTVDRDNQRKANEDKYGCYMTDEQIDRGDCDIPEEEEEVIEEEVVEEKEEEVIIEENEKEKPDTEEVISDNDVVVPEVVVDDEDKEPVEQPKEEVIEDELDQEIPGDDDIREEGVQEKDVKDENNKEEEIKEEEEVEETEEIILEPEEEPEELEQEPVQDPVELTEEEIAVEVAEVEDIVEDIKEVEVEELETEQVIEVLAEVADVGVENLTEVSEDVLQVVSEVIEEVITIATEEVLTEKQVEVVQEVLNLEEPEDVQIIAEAVKEDEAVAEAVQEYVERAVENADVEDYNLADVVTEIQTEEFLADPVGAFTDIDIAAIDLTSLGDTMTSTQKEKAQEVVVPVIIASQIVASVQVVPVRIRRRV